MKSGWAWFVAVSLGLLACNVMSPSPPASAGAVFPEPNENSGGGSTPMPASSTRSNQTLSPPCGEIAIDDVLIPLDCVSATYSRLGAMPESVLVNTGAAQIASAALPSYVDHRADRSEGPIRQQGRTGSSSALALASVLDHAMISAGFQVEPVSALHIWLRTRRSSLAAAIQHNAGHGITSEPLMPYDEAMACSWADAAAARLCKPRRGGEGMKRGYLLSAGTKPTVYFYDVRVLNEKNIETLREAIAQNHDVLAALRVDPTVWQQMVRTSEPDPMLPDYRATAAVQSVALVGYAQQDNSWFFLIKNSWGPSWGAQGYAWIHEHTLRTHLLAAFVVRATRFDRARAP